MKISLSHIVATGFMSGHMKPAPGTWGSLFALLLAFPIHYTTGVAGLAAGAALAVILGAWSVAKESAATGQHDAKEWVIDEIAGQWIALLPVGFGATMMHIPLSKLWPGWVAAFVLFRLFDITKPWLVGKADRKNTSFSVIEDDIWAGIFAALVMAAMAGFAHKFLM